jgi:hypothetical protein
MVKLFSTEHTYKHPWSHVTSAFWRKYPNPLATHVRQVDCYERKLCPTTHNLITHRLIAVESVLPSWMDALGFPTSAYVAETSVVNPKTREMIIKSRNISGSSVMTVEETCRYTSHPTQHNWTVYTQEARISAFMPFISSRMESWSHSSLVAKSQQGLEAMELLCNRVKAQGLESLCSLGDTFNAFVAGLAPSAVTVAAAATAATAATAAAAASATR